MAKGYTDKTTLQNYTLQTIDSSFDSQITAWIESIEAYIDQFTGRNFVADSEATERVYDGDDTAHLLIDDCVEVTKVEVGEETEVEITSDNYYLYPSNSLPKNKITLKNNIFERGNQNVTITARWGYSVAAPSDIKLAATILLAGIIAYADKSSEKVKSERIGNYSVSYDDDKGWADFKRVHGILDAYRRFSL